MRRHSDYAVRGPMEIKMTPMIDVVFLLLVFFVWTASFQIVEQILPSSLSAVSGSQPSDPSQPPPPEKDFPDVVIRITWNGSSPSWQLNDNPVGSLDEVKAQLQAIVAIKADAPVILHPDKEVPLGHVIDLYDVSRMLGFEKVQFAASEAI